MGDGRLELLEQNVIHEFDNALVRRNLRGCYGKLAKMFYEGMLDNIAGTRVLDAGCGFGLFSRLCKDRGFRVHAIDIDEHSLQIAREEFKLECRLESVYETSLPADSIDTVVFNDVVCHLEFPALMAEIARLGARRLIVFDSNIWNPLLRFYRYWSGHEEFQDYNLRQTIEHIERYDFKVRRSVFHNYLALPISGGLQRKPIPVLNWFPRVIDLGDRVLGKVLPWTGLSGYLAFRYLAVFDRNDPRVSE